MMSRTIEADFFLPDVDAIKGTSRALMVDNNHNVANSAEPALKKVSRSSTFEVGDAKLSSKPAES
jgi:hypothetical protein